MSCEINPTESCAECKRECANHNRDDCAGEHLKPGPIIFVPKPSALDVQEGGNHYKGMPIQPVEYIYKNGIGYFEGCVIKYVSRWKKKNGLEDLKKARHFIDLLIELEGANG